MVDPTGSLGYGRFYYTSFADVLSESPQSRVRHVFRYPPTGHGDFGISFSRSSIRTRGSTSPWFFNNFRRWAEMLPAPSETLPGRLAYYQSVEKRVRDIRTPIKPGKWLQKVFGDILTQP